MNIYTFCKTSLFFIISTLALGMSLVLTIFGSVLADGQIGLAADSMSRPRPWRDPGVDIGIVKKRTIMFSDHAWNSAGIGSLTPGDWVVLVSKDLTNGLLPIIQLSSGREGWVRPERLNIHYTNHRNPSVDLGSGATGIDGLPTLSVENDSDKNLFLHVQGIPETLIRAHVTQSVNVLPGVWSYNASAADTIPDFGNGAFVKGFQYTWRFYIRKVSIFTPNTQSMPSIVSPLQKAQMRDMQDDVDKKEAEITLLKAQLDDEKTALGTQEANLTTCDDEVDAKHQTLDLTDQSAVDAYNVLVDNANSQRNMVRQARDKYNADVDAYNAKIDILAKAKQQLKDRADTLNKD